MAVIGYIRVSSNKQTVQHQRFEIGQFAEHNNITVDRWVEETISSRKALNKRKLGQLLNELQDGDILIAAEISRLERSLLACGLPIPVVALSNKSENASFTKTLFPFNWTR